MKIISERHILLLLVALLLDGCGSHVKISRMSSNDVIENEYASFSPPDGGWYYTNDPWVLQAEGKAQFARIENDAIKGASYTIDFKTWPFGWLPDPVYFDKDTDYPTILKDEDMTITKRDKEQGVSYKRRWVIYLKGMKCYEGVFSRSQGGIMKDMHSKNYSLTCGYYDKTEGKRILSMSYRYNYAGGSIRHQKDKNTPQADLLTLKQAELGIKQAVKQLVGTIKIKNMDRERMEREGLLHHDKQYEISPY